MNKAVFLDRDGVINGNVLNADTGEWESPRDIEHFILFPWAIKALRRLQDHQFYLFLVSNQPNYAKGKTSLESIKAIHQKLHFVLIDQKIFFTEYFYCYHHPQGIMPEVSFQCACRKPNTFFLKEAERKYFLDMKSSWMIGDRDSDIICGQKAGTKTILILNKKGLPSQRSGISKPDFKVNDLLEAADIIAPLSFKRKE